MKENIWDMRERHKREEKELQERCLHKFLTEWIDMCPSQEYYSGRYIMKCQDCDKTIYKSHSRCPDCKYSNWMAQSAMCKTCGGFRFVETEKFKEDKKNGLVNNPLENTL